MLEAGNLLVDEEFTLNIDLVAHRTTQTGET